MAATTVADACCRPGRPRRAPLDPMIHSYDARTGARLPQHGVPRQRGSSSHPHPRRILRAAAPFQRAEHPGYRRLLRVGPHPQPRARRRGARAARAADARPHQAGGERGGDACRRPPDPGAAHGAHAGPARRDDVAVLRGCAHAWRGCSPSGRSASRCLTIGSSSVPVAVPASWRPPTAGRSRAAARASASTSSCRSNKG